MTYNNYTVAELKRLYPDRPGFIFTGGAPSSRESCEKLYTQIKDQKICEYEPDFIVELNPATYVFVYPEGVSFKSGEFYEMATHASMLMLANGIFKVDILAAFLKEN